MVIFFTGTGNSRIIAERIAEGLGEACLDSFGAIRRRAYETYESDTPWIFVAPTYAWRLPKVFEEFLLESEFQGSPDAYFVMTCGDDIGNADWYIRKLCKKKGLTYHGVKGIKMPENYTAMFDVPGQEEVDEIIRAALSEADRIVRFIKERLDLFDHHRRRGDNIKSRFINQPFYRLFVNAKGFHTTDLCNGCGFCEQHCPCSNIHMISGKPSWGEHCTHCMACINGCPQLAVEYKKTSIGKPRIYDGTAREAAYRKEEEMDRFDSIYYESSTGTNRIHALMCIPEGEIRGIVQISHGIAEHIDRYRDFMRFLADHGYLAVGNDHLGHGKSIAEEREKGRFHEENGWRHAAGDMAALHDRMHASYPDVKYVLFGHSMGSFLARTYMADYPEKYDLAILSGTGHQGKLMIAAGNRIAAEEIRKNGYDGDGKKLAKLTMGGYLKKISNPKTDFDWLSRDEQQVQKYVSDDLCGFAAKAGLYADMLKGIQYVTDLKNIKKMDRYKPVLFLSGKEDPVGEYGKGVERAAAAFRKAGLRNVKVRLYEGGRHEMLNETNRKEVFEDILSWMKEWME